MKTQNSADSSLAKPKKLIRSGITVKLKEGEWEEVTDLNELNKLYALKIREELSEIQQADHKDIMEFIDLIEVAYQFAFENGFDKHLILTKMIQKRESKGVFGKLALNNLNPNNPSNQLYFDE